MKNWLTQMFGFSKREYNGILFLLLLCVLMALAPSIYRLFLLNDKQPNQKDIAVLQELEVIDRYQRELYNKNNSGQFGGSDKAINYHPFNPNEIGVEVWQNFGLSKKQALSIVNYVKKGGQFRKPEDLQKMYTISPEKYQALLPFVVIPEVVRTEKSVFSSTYIKKENVIVNINDADTTTLTLIKGVGPSFARRIANYRDKLGGFYKKEQLLEIFGVDTAKYLEIKDQINIDISGLRKIKINKVEFEELKTHPYLKYKQSNAIIQYRKQHGNYNDATDLSKIVLLNAEVIQRISPYLSFE